jgi:hypothetical protein
MAWSSRGCAAWCVYAPSPRSMRARSYTCRMLPLATSHSLKCAWITVCKSRFVALSSPASCAMHDPRRPPPHQPHTSRRPRSTELRPVIASPQEAKAGSLHQAAVCDEGGGGASLCRWTVWRVAGRLCIGNILCPARALRATQPRHARRQGAVAKVTWRSSTG